MTATRGAIFIATVFVAVTIADYFIGVNSSAMKFARSEVQNSPMLRQRVGTISDVKLRKFWGYAHKTGYGNSTSRLNLVVVGERESVRMKVELKQVDEKWTVVESSVQF